MSIQAAKETKILALGREQLKEILGDQVQKIIIKNQSRWSLQRHETLKKLTKMQQEKIISNLEFKTLPTKTKAFEKVNPEYSLIILITGALLLEEKKTHICNKGDCLLLLQAYDCRNITEDVVTEGETQIAYLTKGQIQSLLKGDIEQAVSNNANSHENRLMNYKFELKADEDKITIDNIKVMKSLGQGQFGKVYLIKCEATTNYYALKIVKKKAVIEQGIEKHIKQERKTLEIVSFPFIVNFVKYMEDKDSIFFVLEFISGLELFDAIREIGLLNSFESKFYVSIIILALEYLHSCKMIYRDLKPENIIVDADGYLKIIDLGTAKILENHYRTFTTIGTPHYIAPEVFSGKGYSFMADLWSLGIIIYEFMCGYVPFGEDESDPYAIYEIIIHTRNLTFAKYFNDPKAKSVIEQLLNKTPDLRLGGSYAALKNHQWFQDIDWDKLMDRKIKAPYKPPANKVVGPGELRELSAKSMTLKTHLKTSQ